MQTVSVVLSVGKGSVDAFERGFREHELPVWRDLLSRGVMLRASLTRLEISTRPVDSATQYQIAGAEAFGGDTILHQAA